ncbi:winged helix-turn-helix transcriptional regulator [Agrobacterium tumefaciens]|uniref:winged helix-turn-helix transcriptional regulator n=1 Tax=Agrobacterium tumefaciens TaxID=358 RepID=UPI0015732885|nr:helix-turn-helix domain-containing protein [Agrobacterium tumefaciens]NSZ66547.1 helix-turn-helix transcriptional regulator [Agrobacterium tumefaciens]NTA19437.1 helix-turn-helix transcriptional regulator [Agrobacterium tumefaciens]NTA72919.1 helix-turn-helix transcriptional regulator [Agrobacterium tumefaciens]WCK74336.1 helix-turn-helix domain-containing protein [Agrobacterium tumefaciens]WIE41467.1 helix-turn-helix domain-containing protein [Agrobacterium tumefaciens]
MTQKNRSGCPINLTLEQIGDRWSLIVIRDMIFENRRSYGALLERNAEGIASNILASRLKHLTASGLLTRSSDPHHKQKGVYSLTEAAIQLVPVIAHLAAWGLQHTHPSKEASMRAELLEKGGPSFWSTLMDELRYLHLGAPRPAHSAFGELRTDHEKANADEGSEQEPV